MLVFYSFHDGLNVKFLSKDIFSFVIDEFLIAYIIVNDFCKMYFKK